MKRWTKVEEPLPLTVLVPYTRESGLLQSVVDSLRVQFVQPEARKIHGKFGYWELLCEYWARGDAFFVVEQDVIAWCGAIKHMADCPETWCTTPLLCRGSLFITSLGCAKFSKELVTSRPTLVEDLEDHDWHWLDKNIAESIGMDPGPHAHYPPSTHLNEIQWPNTISRRWAYRKVWQLDTNPVADAAELFARLGWVYKKTKEATSERK